MKKNTLSLPDDMQHLLHHISHDLSHGAGSLYRIFGTGCQLFQPQAVQLIEIVLQLLGTDDGFRNDGIRHLRRPFG